MTKNVLLLATLTTKQEEVEYLSKCLADHEVDVKCLDVSLDTGGKILDGIGKAKAMQKVVDRLWDRVASAVDDGVHVIVGLGGGTGGEMILQVLRALPITFPKVLVSTLPFDPRIAVADNSIILVPTLADICGLNATLREMLENTAAMTAGLCTTRRKGDACIHVPSIGVTALGATDKAIGPLINGFQKLRQETTVFHANGYGGAAFARFAARGAFHTVIDLTPHELTRIELAGAHVPMPERFSAARDKPRIVLPGGLNFIGLGQKSLVPPEYLKRPHYAHSGYFTHAKLTEDEMSQIAKSLAEKLNQYETCALIIPMGGFSHQDRPGGAIEDPSLRAVFADTVSAHLNSNIEVVSLPHHLFDPEVTKSILETYEIFKTEH